MENYTITKEQVLGLSELDKTVKVYLQKNFPDAFKKELGVCIWYKSNAGRIVFRTCDSDNYGFCSGMIWREDLLCYDNNNWKEATDEEVEASLINEAKKRGYKKGINCAFGMVKEKRRLETDDFMLSTDNKLCVKRFNSQISDIIFKDGKWAEIIPEETKVITMEKAVKILSKKYGKKVIIK